MRVTWLRIITGLLLLAVVAVAVVPLLVLLDLAGGGGGYGLCPDGLGGCEVRYTAWLELAAGLVVVIFALIALLRLTMRMIRREERRQEVASLMERFSGRE